MSGPDLDRSVDVPLNLEETACMCHLLLRSLMDDKQATALFQGRPHRDGYVARMNHLYEKLAKANDMIMGKEPMSPSGRVG